MTADEALPRTTCRTCGRSVVLARVMVLDEATGKYVPGAECPMDVDAPVYRVVEREGRLLAMVVNGPRAKRTPEHGTYLTSHFRTCGKLECITEALLRAEAIAEENE